MLYDYVTMIRGTWLGTPAGWRTDLVNAGDGFPASDERHTANRTTSAFLDGHAEAAERITLYHSDLVTGRDINHIPFATR